jgi:hypothetical protein
MKAVIARKLLLKELNLAPVAHPPGQPQYGCGVSYDKRQRALAVKPYVASARPLSNAETTVAVANLNDYAVQIAKVLGEAGANPYTRLEADTLDGQWHVERQMAIMVK